MTFKTSTDEHEATVNFGKQVGSLLKGGEVIELAGDLGSGKTTFMQGMLSGLGYRGEVPSPTYSISRVYGLKNGIDLYHFDFYRIQGTDVVTSELAEVLDEPSAIVAVEWSSNIGDHVLPYDRLTISLSQGVNLTDRDISVRSTSEKYAYIIRGLS